MQILKSHEGQRSGVTIGGGIQIVEGAAYPFLPHSYRLNAQGTGGGSGEPAKFQVGPWPLWPPFEPPLPASQSLEQRVQLAKDPQYSRV